MGKGCFLAFIGQANEEGTFVYNWNSFLFEMNSPFFG